MEKILAKTENLKEKKAGRVVQARLQKVVHLRRERIVNLKYYYCDPLLW